MFLIEWKSLKEYNSLMWDVISPFMKTNDVEQMLSGRYELEKGCYVNVDDCETRENHNFEAHRVYVDVQLMINGEEEVFVAPIEKGLETEAYDGEKDVAFYACEEGTYDRIPLTSGMAMVLLPEDLHAPCNWAEKKTNRKLVFKIPVELVCGGKKKKISCCGDSITFGLLASTPEHSYPSVLQKLLGDAYQVGNYGRNGATVIADYDWLSNRYSPYRKSPEYPLAMESRPDVVVLMLGMNDANPTHHFNAENGGPISDKYLRQYEDTLKKLLKGFKELPTKPQVFLARTTAMKRVVCAQFDEAYIRNFTENLILIRGIQEKVANEYEISSIDTLSEMDNMEFYRDGCHLTDAGYEQLAKIIFRTITMERVS